jgi:molecular chaperone DnaK
MDITPLSLGVRTKTGYAELVAAHTPIPVRKSDTFTTTQDSQSEVQIEIFNGSLDGEAKIGSFFLTGIPPCPAGEPQIKVTFDIDASCVLEVTARDHGTGRSESIRIEDTTLLPPAEVARITRRFQEQRELEELRRSTQAKLQVAADRLAQLEALAGDCEAAWLEFGQRMAVFRPGGGPLDDETQRILADLFRRERELEATVRALAGAVPDLLDEGRALQAGSADASGPVAGSSAGGGDLGDGGGRADPGRLAERLGTHVALASELLATLAAWNAALITASMACAGPLAMFRSNHDAGDYRAALDWLPDPVEDIADIRRHLHCLAEVGDAEGYRDALLAQAEQLGAQLGEVIAIITSVQHRGAAAAFAVAVDSLSDLLTEVGIER